MKKKYEIMFILNVRMDEESRTGILDKIKQAIEKAEGTVEKVEDMGRKRLAYLIQKQTDGHYFLINFEANPKLIDGITRVCKLSEHVLRDMIVEREEKKSA